MQEGSGKEERTLYMSTVLRILEGTVSAKLLATSDSVAVEGKTATFSEEDKPNCVAED